MRIHTTRLFAVLAVGAGLVATACTSGGSRPPAASSSPRTVTSSPSVTSAPCEGTANTPGGPDPWGGCWPGPENTGPPSGLALTPYRGQVSPDGACMITVSTVITDNTIACQIIVKSGNLTLKDSSLTGEVYNYGPGQVVIEDSTINGGGSAQTETVLGSNVTIVDSDLYGNQHEVYCSSDCTIVNSWLHDNHNFGPADHQNGFLSTGGTHYDLQHNTIDCTGHCTSDVAFLGNESNAVVSQNLLVAGPTIAYCLYAYSESASVVVNRMTITDNVFQRGRSAKCATYGPVAGWNEPNDNPGTSGYRNIWSGNTWSNGEPLPAP